MIDMNEVVLESWKIRSIGIIVMMNVSSKLFFHIVFKLSVLYVKYCTVHVIS